MMKQMTGQTALDAYIEVVDEATKLSDRIAMFLADYGEVAPDDVDWGHAGSMNHVYDLLKQVVDFIGGDTDDAAAYDAEALRDYDETVAGFLAGTGRV